MLCTKRVQDISQTDHGTSPMACPCSLRQHASIEPLKLIALHQGRAANQAKSRSGTASKDLDSPAAAQRLRG
ncbi:hypothetical protein P368_22445 [Comamonas thiooxydans]|nr:hypothetical protein P369_21020 [Comamonas thiooxydans]KGG95227.1 hypothetical protein P367_21655 [Comamonas thiooxydans]KGG96832.1 hypothetical protein P365_24540 [Comamonas thiooxydans]KGH06209.1 hypothetical protein P368_22445 [Comamonas thiooxydans]